MEFLIVVIFIIASIYSEVNKKKKEGESIDIDDLMSLDDFTSSSSNKTSYVPPLPKPNKSRQKILKKRARQTPPPPPKPKLEILDGLAPLDDAPEIFGKGLEGKRERNMSWEATSKKSAVGVSKFSLQMSRDEVVKAFVFSEIMQRYNINRIYDRIPGINEDNLES